MLATPIADLLALVAERLRQSTGSVVQSLERALQEERTRTAMGKFTLMLIVTYSLYPWVLGTATQVKEALGRSELVTLPAVIFTVTMLFWFMRSSGYPAARFGLTLKRARRHVPLALRQGRPERAGQLLDFADRFWRRHFGALNPEDRRDVLRARRRCRRELGRAAGQRAWDDGAALPLAAAVAVALA